MRRLKAASLTAILLSLFFTNSAVAGAWLLPEGKHQLITGIRHYHADRFTDAQGRDFESGDYHKTSLETLWEYGYSERLTLGAKLDLAHARDAQAADAPESTGVDALALFARHDLGAWEGWCFSAQPLIALPRFGGGEHPALGHDATELELRFLAGRNLELLSPRDFLNLEGAYRHRSGAASDQWRMEAGLGLRPNDWLIVMPQLFVTHSVDLAYAGTPLEPSSDRDYRLATAQLSAIAEINEGLSVQLGAFRDVYARNTGEGAGVLLSAWIRF